MAFSKITLNGTTLMDVTQDTVTASTLLSGEYATKADGVRVQGTLVPGEPSPEEPYVSEYDNKVYFIDYDGELLYTYTKEEFLIMQSMPSNPTHDGLTSDGWNWTLSDAQEYVQAYDCLVIGQMYHPTDGKTKLYISIPNGVPAAKREVHLYFEYSGSGSVIIDWGDGSATTTRTGTSTSESGTVHTYSECGNYVISFTCTGTYNLILGYRSASSVLGNASGIYPTYLYKVVIGDQTSINDYAFNNTRNLTSIIIPKTYSYEVAKAPIFFGSACYKLKAFIYPTLSSNVSSNLTITFNKAYELEWISFNKDFNNKVAIDNSNKLKVLTLPSAANSIYCSVCTTLEMCVLSSTITELPNNCFQKCYKLNCFKNYGNLRKLGSYAFANTGTYLKLDLSKIESFEYGATIGMLFDTVELSNAAVLSYNLFQNCVSLKEIKNLNTATFSNKSAQNLFANCYNLTGDISLPSNAKTGNSIFENCYKIDSITLPSDFAEIGQYCFSRCSKLTSIEIPSSVSKINNYAFQYCYNLKNMSIPSGVTSIGTYTFLNCTSLTSVDIPNLSILPNYMFQNCISLSSIALPSTLTSIPAYMFSGCSSLQSITIPNSVTTISNNAFTGCGFSSITIPSSVTLIGQYIFSSCFNLQHVYTLNSTPPNAISGFIDSNSNYPIIYVPYSADHSILSAYQTATNWAAHSSKMVEMDPT